MFIDENGKKWFRGNLHTHTTVSDGKYTPEAAIALYQSRGYDFLALTDHWKRSESRMTEDGMLLLSGIEYNIHGADVLRGVYHILGIGMTRDAVFTRDQAIELDPQTVIDEIHRCGGAAILAHPAWSMNTCEQLLPLQHVDMTEIYNSVSGLPNNCRPYSGEVIDLCAVRGKRLLCSAADDSHFYTGEECLSYIWVQADALTPDAILGAIRAGRIMATQGPLFSVSVTQKNDDEKEVRVTCRPAPGGAPIRTVVFYTGSVWCTGRSVNGEALTEAVFPLRAKDTFVRPEIIDADGHHAWASPILF